MYDPRDDHDPEDFVMDSGEHDDWDDPMFTLPNEFLTSFPINQLAHFKRAVRTWPQGSDFQVTDRNSQDQRGRGQGSLWYYGSRADLTNFWAHFEAVNRPKRRKPMAGRTRLYVIAAICQNAETLTSLQYSLGPNPARIAYYQKRQRELRAQLNHRS